MKMPQRGAALPRIQGLLRCCVWIILPDLVVSSQSLHKVHQNNTQFWKFCPNLSKWSLKDCIISLCFSAQKRGSPFEFSFIHLQARGKKRQIGWFPANYVKLLSPSTNKTTPTEPTPPKLAPAGTGKLTQVFIVPVEKLPVFTDFI